MTKRLSRRIQVGSLAIAIAWLGCGDIPLFAPGPDATTSSSSASSGSGGGGSSSSSTGYSTGAWVGCAPFETDCDGTCADLITDESNCGACGRDCLGGPCHEATCRPAVVASGQNAPSGIAVDATHVYWTCSGDGTVKKAPIAGGDQVLLHDSPDGGAWTITVDATSVYWADRMAGTVNKAPIAGGDVVVLSTDQKGTNDITVDATHVYWAYSAQDSGVSKVPLGGGATITMSASAQVFGPNGIAVNASHVYWSDGGPNGSVKMRPLGADFEFEVVAGLPFPSDVALDATSVYWLNAGNNGRVNKAPLGGGTPIVELTPGMADVRALAVDASGAYFGSADRVMSVPLEGGEPITLASEQESVTDIVVDASRVYWVDSDAGTVMMVVK